MTSPGGPIAERVSLSDFRAQEPGAPPDEIWELIDGAIVKQERADTLAHNEIVTNLTLAIGNRLRAARSPCRVYAENARLVNDRNDVAVYPDIAVRCGPRRLDQKEMTDPVFLVEVLSRSTAEKDRYDKAEAYFRIPSIAHYWLVAQDRMDVTVMTRGEADWQRRRFHSPDDVVVVEPLGLAVPLSEIYDGVPEIVGGEAPEPTL